MAQTPDSTQSLPHDSSRVDVRTVDSETLKSLTDDEAFDYSQSAENPESLWSRIKRWMIQILFGAFQNKWVRLFFKISFFAIFAFVLIGLINQILGGNIKGAFSSKKPGKNLSLNANGKVISKRDLDEMLDSAVSENRFSDAVRILYLKALNELNESGFIELKQNKTNHDYLSELSSHPARGLFSRLTLYYEYVEYGGFNIGQNGFDSAMNIYRQLQQKTGEQP